MAALRNRLASKLENNVNAHTENMSDEELFSFAEYKEENTEKAPETEVNNTDTAGADITQNAQSTQNESTENGLPTAAIVAIAAAAVSVIACIVLLVVKKKK